MAAPTLHITPITGLTAPSDCYISSQTEELDCPAHTVKDGVTGKTVLVVPSETVESKASIDGSGRPPLSTISAGEITAGTYKSVDIEVSESADGVPTFKVSAETQTART